MQAFWHKGYEATAMGDLATPFQDAQVDTPKPPDFGSLASLVGEWQGKDPEGKPMTASYQWARGGTSLVKTLTMAEKPAMTTMYRADKGELMLTHDCALGNQPRMRAAMPKSDAKPLAFNFVDATNLSGSPHPGMGPQQGWKGTATSVRICLCEVGNVSSAPS